MSPRATTASELSNESENDNLGRRYLILVLVLWPFLILLFLCDIIWPPGCALIIIFIILSLYIVSASNRIIRDNPDNDPDLDNDPEEKLAWNNAGFVTSVIVADGVLHLIVAFIAVSVAVFNEAKFITGLISLSLTLTSGMIHAGYICFWCSEAKYKRERQQQQRTNERDHSVVVNVEMNDFPPKYLMSCDDRPPPDYIDCCAFNAPDSLPPNLEPPKPPTDMDKGSFSD